MNILASVIGSVIATIIKIGAMVGLGYTMASNSARKKIIKKGSERNEIDASVHSLSKLERRRWLRRRSQ
mgnify:CR=1 FL=1|tara:strand:- start:8338 stop:8544 length:207 start_codon:yes stop_codon:yes gene_type:complete